MIGPFIHPFSSLSHSSTYCSFFFFPFCLKNRQPMESRKIKQDGLTVLFLRKVTCAALVTGLSAALGTLFVSLSLLSGIGQDYGWGFFVGLPFAMGLTSAVTYGHHEKRNAKTCIGIALLTLAFSFLLLIEPLPIYGCSHRLTSTWVDGLVS